MNFYFFYGENHQKNDNLLKIKDNYGYIKQFFSDCNDDFVKGKPSSDAAIKNFLGEGMDRYFHPKNRHKMPSIRDFIVFDMYADAKDIDVLGIQLYKSLLISPKVKSIMEQFNLPPQAGFYEVRIRQGKTKIYPYYLLFLLELPMEPCPIDFEHSFFHEYHYPEGIIKRNIKVKNYEEFYSYNWCLNVMEDAELYINHYAYQYDLFSLSMGVGGMIITERLALALKENGIAGWGDRKPITSLRSI